MVNLITQSRELLAGSKFIRRLLYATFFFFVAIGTGIIGFMLIEGYTFNEAVYMTIITFSTVGYGEVHPLTPIGKSFTTFLIILNIGAFTYIVSVISAFIFEGDLAALLKHNQMEHQISKLKDHVIICGYGRLGRVVADDLINSGRTVLIVEKDPDVIEMLEKKSDRPFFVGDATDEETIMAMGIKSANSLITTFHSDASNTFVTLSARELNPKIEIISRASAEPNISKLKLAGANHVIIPEDIGGSYIASLVTGKMI